MAELISNLFLGVVVPMPTFCALATIRINKENNVRISLYFIKNVLSDDVYSNVANKEEE
jgi:hypothetical protein